MVDFGLVKFTLCFTIKSLIFAKEIVEAASIEDLDVEAIKRARELFSKRQSDRKKAQEVLDKLSDIEVLNKAGITIKGKKPEQHCCY